MKRKEIEAAVKAELDQLDDDDLRLVFHFCRGLILGGYLSDASKG